MHRFWERLLLGFVMSVALMTLAWAQEEDGSLPPPNNPPYSDTDTGDEEAPPFDQGEEEADLSELIPDDVPVEELLEPLPPVETDEDEETNISDDTEPPSSLPAPPDRLPGEDDQKLPPAYKIAVDAIININYSFLNGVDKFKVKYAINLSDILKPRMTKVKGNASISTDISGTLARWPGGECALSIATDSVPFEINVTPANGVDRQMAIKFNRGISESWQSKCSFIDDPDAHFNTSAGGEKWVENALRKTSPQLNQLSVTFNQASSSTLTFYVEKQKVVEEGIGSAEVDGTGIISIEPIAAEQP